MQKNKNNILSLKQYYIVVKYTIYYLIGQYHKDLVDLDTNFVECKSTKSL